MDSAKFLSIYVHVFLASSAEAVEQVRHVPSQLLFPWARPTTSGSSASALPPTATAILPVTVELPALTYRRMIVPGIERRSRLKEFLPRFPKIYQKQYALGGSSSGSGGNGTTEELGLSSGSKLTIVSLQSEEGFDLPLELTWKECLEMLLAGEAVPAGSAQPSARPFITVRLFGILETSSTLSAGGSGMLEDRQPPPAATLIPAADPPAHSGKRKREEPRLSIGSVKDEGKKRESLAPKKKKAKQQPSSKEDSQEVVAVAQAAEVPSKTKETTRKAEKRMSAMGCLEKTSTTSALSKKEAKKLEKAAKRKSLATSAVTREPTPPSTPVPSAPLPVKEDPVEELSVQTTAPASPSLAFTVAPGSIFARPNNLDDEEEDDEYCPMVVERKPEDLLPTVPCSQATNEDAFHATQDSIFQSAQKPKEIPVEVDFAPSLHPQTGGDPKNAGDSSSSSDDDGESGNESDTESEENEKEELKKDNDHDSDGKTTITSIPPIRENILSTLGTASLPSLKRLSIAKTPIGLDLPVAKKEVSKKAAEDSSEDGQSSSSSGSGSDSSGNSSDTEESEPSPAQRVRIAKSSKGKKRGSGLFGLIEDAAAAVKPGKEKKRKTAVRKEEPMLMMMEAAPIPPIVASQQSAFPSQSSIASTTSTAAFASSVAASQKKPKKPRKILSPSKLKISATAASQPHPLRQTQLPITNHAHPVYPGKIDAEAIAALVNDDSLWDECEEE